MESNLFFGVVYTEKGDLRAVIADGKGAKTIAEIDRDAVSALIGCHEPVSLGSVLHRRPALHYDQ